MCNHYGTKLIKQFVSHTCTSAFFIKMFTAFDKVGFQYSHKEKYLFESNSEETTFYWLYLKYITKIT